MKILIVFPDGFLVEDSSLVPNTEPLPFSTVALRRLQDELEPTAFFVRCEPEVFEAWAKLYSVTYTWVFRDDGTGPAQVLRLLGRQHGAASFVVSASPGLAAACSRSGLPCLVTVSPVAVGAITEGGEGWAAVYTPLPIEEEVTT